MVDFEAHTLCKHERLNTYKELLRIVISDDLSLGSKSLAQINEQLRAKIELNYLA
jgi:hypothetical protein